MEKRRAFNIVFTVFYIIASFVFVKSFINYFVTLSVTKKFHLQKTLVILNIMMGK